MLRVKTRNEGGRCGGVYVVWVAWVMLLLYVVRDRGGWGEEDRSWIKGVGTGRAPRERRAAHPSIKQVHWAIDRWNRTTGRRGPGGGAGGEKPLHVRCLSSLFHTPRTRGAPPQAHSFCSCTFRSYYSWRWSHPAYRFDSVGCILCRSPALGVQSSHRMPQTHR